ncbi:MAG: hypothetical protein Q8R55_00895 [Candidatus Taylorbacteria bacterium]|nr:hypothetical protein [Candidatus Taylorbacteria bacterium]
MRGLLKVTCRNCRKPFYQRKNHVKENIKLGHGLYCSKTCQFDYRKTGKWLYCQNSSCKKSFYRAKNDILEHNYCCQSCAAIVNNQRYPKWPKRYCIICKKEFKNRDSKYCSSRCGWSTIQNYRQPKYTQAQIVSIIKKYYQRHKRTPAKREIPELTSRTPHIFGSWNNAINAANLTPNRSHDDRMYKRLIGKARDGHKCDSVSEILIDNWLHKNKIAHSRNVSYPDTKHIADWAVNNNDIFIEYFGLAKDSPRYDRGINKKKRLCKKHGIKLIDIYPEDLYKTSNFVNKLEFLMGT